MNFLPIMALCVVTGIVFAALATWLTTTKGNTIREILQSDKLKDAGSLQLEIANTVKLSTGLPIVALYVVGFASAFALPAFMLWLAYGGSKPIFITGRVTPSGGAKLSQTGVRLVPGANFSQPSGSFVVPLKNSEDPQSFVIEGVEGNDFGPVTLNVALKLLKNTATVEVPTVFKSTELSLDGSTLNLADAIVLPPPQPIVAATSVENKPTEKQAISSDFANVAPPTEAKQ